MKKILIAIICLCFALSLVACSELEEFYNPQISIDPPSIDPTPGEDGVSHTHLERLGKDNAWLPVDDNESVFNNDVLWEPGYVQMHLLRVVRKLDSTVRYKVDMVADGELGGLAEYIDVLVMPGLEQLPDPTLESTEGWVYLAPLDVLLSGDSTVSQGQIFAEDTPAYVSFGIALRVREDAEAGLELGAALDLHVEIEYEKSEDDSFDSNYDADAIITADPTHSKDDHGKEDYPKETPHYTVDQGGALPILPDRDHTDKENEKDPVDTTTDYNGDGVIDENDWGIMDDGLGGLITVPMPVPPADKFPEASNGAAAAPDAPRLLPLPAGEIKSITLNNDAYGTQYYFADVRASEFAKYFFNLTVSPVGGRNIETENLPVWVIEIGYADGKTVTVTWVDDAYVKVDGSEWYALDAEEARMLSSLLKVYGY